MKKIMKKVFWMLAVAVMLSCMGISHRTHVSAAEIFDSDSDDTMATANAMTVGDTIKGAITAKDKRDYYKFTLDSAGCVTLNMTSYMPVYCILIYDSDGEKVWYTEGNYWNSNVGYRKDAYALYLEQGKYYMEVNGDDRWDKGTGTYECGTSFVSSGVTNVEPDGTFARANQVSLGNTIVGQISLGETRDTFKFELPNSGRVTLDMTSYMPEYGIEVYDLDGKKIWYDRDNEWTASVGYRQDSYDLYLQKGTYYMQVIGEQRSDNSYSKGKYVIGTKFESSNESFDEDNNSIATASSIEWNKEYRGQISLNDDYDTYKFQVVPSKTVVLNITAYMKYNSIIIYDTSGKEIWSSGDCEWNSNVGYSKNTYNVVLNAGTYYMQVGSRRSSGIYVFKLEDLGPKSCLSHNFVDGTIAPTYFAKGYDIHECIKCGYAYKNRYTAKKKLSQGSFYSDCYVGKGKLYLFWLTVSGATGYEFRYSQDKKFKSRVVTKTINGRSKNKRTVSKLKRKKTYYVQVRAYKKSGTRVAYGSWSPKIALRTK